MEYNRTKQTIKFSRPKDGLNGVFVDTKRSEAIRTRGLHGDRLDEFCLKLDS